ncbi:MAG: flagellar motor protein MotD [Halioglobus sp.]|nr:flagellar motor protein MotD [Halioglobus sp.]|tara:strand:+ start:3588 stop:4487 length:900 start_codon:yes stop_codon:yes gene_type:complete
MVKRIQFEEQSSHDRWVVSYADFITLLFAFFVVMYSISSVNEDKYRVLSNALVGAFNDKPINLRARQVVPLVDTPLYNDVLSAANQPESEEIVVPLRSEAGETVTAEGTRAPEFEDQFSQQALDAAEQEVNAISETVEERMQPSIDDELINVERNKFWLEVEIKSSLLFESGHSALIPSAVPLLLDLADILAELPNRIHVEGFTDNQPIRTPLFPSNWELSAARAAAVVRLFERHGVDPSRMASIGYGEYQPVGDNDTEEARARNRRVVLVVLAAMGGKDDDRIHEFELLRASVVSADY